MEKQKTFDNELKQLLELLNTHNIAPDDWKDDFVRDITNWFDENAVYVAALDLGLYQEINQILDDGVITDDEYDSLTEYIKEYLQSHKQFDYNTYKATKQRLSRADIASIIVNSELDKDFIGKTVVLTGVFSRFPIRKEAEAEVRMRGGKTAQSISNATNMFIYGANAGWSKVEQVKTRNAQGQNIMLVDEETFYKMLESNEAIGDFTK